MQQAELAQPLARLLAFYYASTNIILRLAIPPFFLLPVAVTLAEMIRDQLNTNVCSKNVFLVTFSLRGVHPIHSKTEEEAECACVWAPN